MSSYQRLSDGKETTADDPQRGIWYPAGNCGYWTDDWSKLDLTRSHGIPCCPKCGVVGLQTTAEDWLGGAKRFEAAGHPGYLEFLQACKEQCGGRNAKDFLTRYEDWSQTR